MQESELVTVPQPTNDAPILRWSREQVDLIKRTVARGATDDELALFIHTCQRTGLDPLARQIYAIKRAGQMTIQTGIDGYRLTAARTGAHAGTDDTIFDAEEAPHPQRATTTVYRFVKGERCAFSATARWDEYAQGSPTWDRMPYLMLAKVSEALALRKAFPADLSGVYTHEEMLQADVTPGEGTTGREEHTSRRAGKITEPQRRRLFALCKEHGVSTDDLKRVLSEIYHLESTNDIEPGQYEVICQAITDGSIREFLSVGALTEGDARG